MAAVAEAVLPPTLRAKDYKSEVSPVWCPGCGHYAVLSAVTKALAYLRLPTEDVAIVSGIGCSSRVPGYLDCDTFHTLHGRAIPAATGVKLARPNMDVVVFGGDGDIMAIGGNHFIHAARRNLDITVFVVNNRTYGMTGGQYSPTTPTHEKAATAPYGNCERSFDICFMARASGAMFVARSTTYHVAHLKKMMKLALSKTGFSVVEIVSQCPTLYGRHQRIGDGVAMLKWFKENSVDVSKVEDPWHEHDKFVIGVLHDREEVPPYTKLYEGVRDAARNGGRV